MRDNADKKVYLRKTLRYAFIYGSSCRQRLSTVYKEITSKEEHTLLVKIASEAQLGNKSKIK
jgi:hypothetical protein